MGASGRATPSAVRSVVSWVGKGAWAITDQGLFAVSNFLLNIGLARTLPPAEYGAFTLGYTIFLLLGTGHTALLTEPMLVFGSGKYREQTSDYLGVVIHGHWRLTAAAGVLLAAAGLIISATSSQHTLADTLIALALASPLILLQWLMRRACYVHFQPQLAAQAGLWYIVILLGGGYGLYRADWLTSATAIGLMAVGSLGSALWILLLLRLPPSVLGGRSRQGIVHLRTAADEHWRYGRWVIGSGLFSWIPPSIYYLLLPLHGGLESTAALKAMMNLIMPLLHAYLPLTVLMVPALVRHRGKPTFGRIVRLSAIGATLGGVVYWLALGLAREPVVHLLYAGRYLSHTSLLWAVGFLCVTGAGVGVFGSALRALERPDLIFWAYALSSAVALTLGVTLMFLFGLPGAAAGLVLSSLATVGMMGVSVWRLRRSASSGASGS